MLRLVNRIFMFTLLASMLLAVEEHAARRQFFVSLGHIEHPIRSAVDALAMM